MDKYDMEQDLKQEVRELKIRISELSNDILQGFSSLNENLSNSFEKIYKQITILSTQPSLSSETVKVNSVNDNQNSLRKNEKQPKILDDYFIDYSYIDKDRYPSFLEILEKHNKDMVECRKSENINTFILSAHRTLESSVSILFDQEFKFINKNNQNFLDAYNKVYNKLKKLRDSRPDNQNYDQPLVYIYIDDIDEINNEIDADDCKKVANNYISRNRIELFSKKHFAASTQILFEIIMPDFYDSNLDLRKKYLSIKNIIQLRNIGSHGSKYSFEEQINFPNNRYAKCLYYSEENFSIIKNLVSWFVEKVYIRLNKISNLTN